MTDAETAARLSRLEDLHAIRDLSARYALAIDTRDYAALGELFTADAIFGGTSDGAASLTGSDRIVASLRARLEAGGPTYHCVHDVVATLDREDPDVAHGIVTTHAEMRSGADTVIKAVRYIDDYRRVAGRWRVGRRLLTFPIDESALPSVDEVEQLTDHDIDLRVIGCNDVTARGSVDRQS